MHTSDNEVENKGMGQDLEKEGSTGILIQHEDDFNDKKGDKKDYMAFWDEKPVQSVIVE